MKNAFSLLATRDKSVVEFINQKIQKIKIIQEKAQSSEFRLNFTFDTLRIRFQRKISCGNCQNFYVEVK